MRVFVAYARADTEQATALVERMRAAGLTVRWDQDLDSGDWSKALRREILDADHFVWFMSDASCASVEVTKEFTVAREAGIPCHILLINAVEPERAVADARSLNWLPLTRLDDAIELCKQAPPKRRAGNGMLWLALALGILGFGTMFLASQCAAPPPAAISRLVYLVVDRSDAMSETLEGQSRWALARDVIADELYLLDARTERVAVRTFGAACDAEQASTRLLSARDAVPTGAALKARIIAVQPDGDVTLLAAMKAAAGDIGGLDTQGLTIDEAVMVVITSGADGCLRDEQRRLDMESVLKAANVTIRYHFLTFSDTAAIRALAGRLEGTVYPVASADDLRNGVRAQLTSPTKATGALDASDATGVDAAGDDADRAVAIRTARGSSTGTIKDPPPVPGVWVRPIWNALQFDFPVGVVHDGAHSYVLEKRGTIQRVDLPEGSAPAKQLFLDLRDRVLNERDAGLLSAAFTPGAAKRPRLFVAYVAQSEAGFEFRLAAFPMEAGQVRLADERILKRHVFRHAANLGGGLAFGPDGMLYLGLGDGGSSHVSAQRSAQSLSSWKGKILRFDVSRSNGLMTPHDNPFGSRGGRAAQAIWAYGVRNPWRFDWDPQGSMWATDTGTNGALAQESVIALQRAGNHRWPLYEGTRRRDEVSGTLADRVVKPVFAYPHDDMPSAIVGGAFVRNTQRGPLTGRYIFGDYMRGRVYALRFGPSGTTSLQRVGAVPQPTSVSRLANGEVVVCSQDGRIYGFGGR